MSIPPFEPGRFDVVAIGSSTGGPALVQHIVTGLPADLRAPVLIAQHLPPAFTASFAKTLAREAALAVYEAEDGMPVVPGTAYLGRGHRHLRVVRRGGAVVLEVSETPKEKLYRPSADELFASCAKVYGRKALAAVMTGIGKDGVEGAKLLHAAGGMVVTQSAATCVVYGMPRACDEAGISAAQLTAEEIRQTILQLSPSHASRV